MYLIQLLLPLYDNKGQALDPEAFIRTRDELVARFGGITTYSRAPANGLWKEGNGQAVRDELVIYEVMTETADKAWWRHYRTELEQRFRQEELVVRVQQIELL